MSKHLTKVKIIGAIACFLILFFIINFWSTISQQILNHQQSSLSQELTISNAVQIEQLIESATHTSLILQSKIKSNPTKIEDISTLAKIIIKNTPSIQHIRISPNDITTHVFPEALTPKYKNKVILAPIMPHNTASQLSTFYSQPQLIDKQYYIKCHIPLSHNNEHWGYLSYQINLDILFNDSQLDFMKNKSYNYQLISMGAYNKSTILTQSNTPLQSELYTAAINIPNNEWFLHLSFNGESTNSLYLINFVFSIMLASVFTLIGYLGLSEPSRLRKKIKRLTTQYESHQLILDQIMNNVNDEIYVSDRNGNVYLNSSNTDNSNHLPANILLTKNKKTLYSDPMFEEDGKTPIHPSEHPINKSLFNNESIIKTVVLSPAQADSYILELRSQPIYDELYNQVGALCIGRRVEINTQTSPTNKHSS